MSKPRSSRKVTGDTSLAISLRETGWASSAIAVLLMAIVIYFLFTTRSEMEHLGAVELSLSNAAYELEVNSVEISLGVGKFLHDGSAESAAKLVDDFQDFDRAFQKLDGSRTEVKMDAALADIHSLHEQTRTAARALVELQPEAAQHNAALRRAVENVNAFLDASLLDASLGWTPIRSQDAARLEVRLDSHAAEVAALTDGALRDKLDAARQQSRNLQAEVPAIALRLYLDRPERREELQRLSSQLLARSDELIDLYMLSSTNLQRLELLGGQLDAVLDEQLQPAIARRINERLGAVQARTNYSIVLFLVSLLGLLSLWIYVWRFLARRVLRPIHALSNHFRQVAVGNLNVTAEVGSRDEIGRLASQFNSTVRSLAAETIARERLDTILADIADFGIICNASGHVRFCSARLLAALGYEASDVRGQPVGSLFPEGADPGTLWRDQGDGAIPRRGLLHGAGGRQIPVDMALTCLEDADRPRYLFVGRSRQPEVDALARLLRLRSGILEAQTTLDRESQRRRELERDLLDIAEREQARIGQELHDDVGQNLSGAAFLGQALANRLAAQSLPEATDAAWIAELLATTLDRLRAISRDLSPAGLESGSLVAALAALCQHVERLHGIHCHLRVQDGPVLRPELPALVARNLFRIVQESVTNSLRHGQATQIKVVLKRGREHGRLSVSDNGLGFDSTAPRIGAGLRNIITRAATLGGKARIRSSSGGTLVMVRFSDHDGPRDAEEINP